MTDKIRYEIDLEVLDDPAKQIDPAIRSIKPDDLGQLAELMLDAYVGTIDYDDETLEDALEEVAGFFADPTARLDRSFAMVRDGEIVSAVLTSSYEGHPFIGYVMTRRSHKGGGLARLVTEKALLSMKSDGETVAVLYITEGNMASERLFHSLGAVRRKR